MVTLIIKAISFAMTKVPCEIDYLYYDLERINNNQCACNQIKGQIFYTMIIILKIVTQYDLQVYSLYIIFKIGQN